MITRDDLLERIDKIQTDLATGRYDHCEATLEFYENRLAELQDILDERTEAERKFELVGKWDPCDAFPDGYSGPIGISGTLEGLLAEIREIIAAKNPCDVDLIAFPDSIWITDENGQIYG